jgi:hypothetical protein
MGIEPIEIGKNPEACSIIPLVAIAVLPCARFASENHRNTCLRQPMS